MPDEKPEYRPAAILKTREADKRGEFERRIVAQTPYDVMTDRIGLECGHTQLIMVSSSFRSQARPTCFQCRDEYLKRESEKNDDLG